MTNITPEESDYSLMRILFVDDNHETCSVFQLALRLNDIQALTAHTGAEALTAFKAEPRHFDAIALDIEMPVMNGLDALEAIRRLPEGKDVPIVMFTGYDNPQYIARALKGGANEILLKPAMPSELADILRHLATQHGQTKMM